mgnify:CR=1 FL=1
MPPTLIGLAYLDTVRPKNVPHFEYLALTLQHPVLLGWRIIVQGSQVIFVSPPGWKPTGQPPKATPGAPSTIVQISRTRLALYWSGSFDDVAALDRGQWPAKPDGKGP